MRVGALCMGYGGLEIALSSLFDTDLRWYCEVDPHASKVLAERFPGVPNMGDLTALDWSRVESIDALTGGYPCQPFSHAGLRKGTDDARHIWPHIADALCVLRPRYGLFENVAGHLSLGFDAVLADLAALGFDAEWTVVRASEVGAPHGRPRVFIAAHANDAAEHRQRPRPQSRRGSETAADTSGFGQQRRARAGRDGSAHCHQLASDASGNTGRFGNGNGAAVTDWGTYAGAIRRWENVTGRLAPSPTDINGRLSPQFVEWLMGLPAGWVTDILTTSPAKKVLGNGVVPQQAAAAFGALLNREAVAA